MTVARVHVSQDSADMTVGADMSEHASKDSNMRPSTPGSQRHSTTGGAITKKNIEKNSTHAAYATKSSKVNERAITVLDMGIHKLRGIREPLHLVQAMPPGLQPRAQCFRRLSSLQQKTPGYFDAPGAVDAPLHSLACDWKWMASSSLPEVTLVFCVVDRYSDMVAANR